MFSKMEIGKLLPASPKMFLLLEPQEKYEEWYGKLYGDYSMWWLACDVKEPQMVRVAEHVVADSKKNVYLMH